MTKTTSVIILMLCCVWELPAQENFPLRTYRPDELVSLNPNVPMNVALDILNGYSQRLENRIIIDSKGHTKPIGVSVENMYWKRAFEFILRSNLLKYNQHERYYEVEELISSKQPESQQEKETPITVVTREVEINAVFFQADYETLHEMGIDWTTFKNGTVRIQTSGAQELGKKFLEASGSGVIQGTRVNVAALLRLFESKKKGEILARPQIRVMDGQKGKIKVGKNFYLILQDFAGNSRYTEYEAGVILSVTPTIYGRNDSTFIHLDIQAERSDVQPDVFGPTKSITEGTTRVLLLNGEETVLAGLLSHEIQSQRKGIPLLKDLPLLRYVFGYNYRAVSKKELIILIQAKIVPGLLTRKYAPPLDFKKQLERERQDFKKYLEPGSTEGRTKAGPTRGASRSPQTKP
ncbi:MAG: type II and III secretion system protein [candidate division KSB1 bacterium]|nr:type II and III secretion system protein [candidate division KSB1 bacterium]MDZ7300893.1 type II and III secretion system protein [candidate division KSB1 bacterium]MDZ7309837.1 type II and III secretion system protein [candidate division KSB1 bacterium]